jgi:hypothetical protein
MNLLILVIYASLLGVTLTPAKVLAWSCESECESNQFECLSWKKKNCPPRNPLQRRYNRLFEDVRGIDMEGYSPIMRPAKPTSPTTSPTMGSSPAVRASRTFAGPGEYPPSRFAAYGIVAFQALPYDTAETNRYRNICRGYLAAIPGSKILLDKGIPLNKQMVTVWPLNDGKLASKLNTTSLEHDEMCSRAVLSIDLVTSRNSIVKARTALRKTLLEERGPYVIAWSPAQSFGKSQAAVLVLNLSNVTTSAQAVEMFREWSDKIEQNPELWTGGWNHDSLRVTLRLWADRWGPGILSLFSPQN